ncbi:class I SAM-dependent methyltransferase [Marinagarivorans algicola]|uniref:class I SAM-dependent methyltransferase n=1 Tax=Marinagarivorans algicola TaxID=1513270 RepID=UPI000AB1A524|nr:methyltransferase domain-containing protein [Marinagarivorans algicola]
MNTVSQSRRQGQTMIMRRVFASLTLAGAFILQGCGTLNHPKAPVINDVHTHKLSQITQALSDKHKARHGSRHPVETLAFFGIKPGDTVVEALPGGGWYSQILVPYLGAQGRLIGVDYNAEMWSHFGGFATPAFIEKRKQWPMNWQEDASHWGPGGEQARAYTFATLPATLKGSVDAVLYIRALHNLARFDAKGGYLTQALAETHRILKPSGVVGIVQHAMAEDKPDSWATGDRGYLKRSAIMAIMDKAGFEFVAESAINQNIKDDPQAGDTVWRLPPTLRTSDDKKADNLTIGESNRVTLLFRKK